MIAILTDSKIANLPLMKIANYYNKVEWYMPLMHQQYEKIYYSKIFNFTPHMDREDEMIRGGTGHSLSITLPPEIEKQQPDYSIYPNCDYSLQYFSRGCIRKCKFCVVFEKEGHITPVEAMQLNPKGKYIRVMDNNFFANSLWPDAIKYLIKIDQPVLFDGLDIRILNEDQCAALKKIKIYNALHFAWDNPKDKIEKKVKLLTKYFTNRRKLCFYILIGFNSTKEEDYERVKKIEEWNCDPFVMPYNKKDEYQKRFARWVNHKAIFKTVKWKDYN